MSCQVPEHYLDEVLSTEQRPEACNVRCVSLDRYEKQDGEPLIYDMALAKTALYGTREEVERTFTNSRIANAQNRIGETLLMKVCRHATTLLGVDRVWVVKLLLRLGADAMVCCESGKNVIHDIFWSAKPPPIQILWSLQEIMETLLGAVGKQNLIGLLLAKDKWGLTPMHYIKPRLQTNWKQVVDTVIYCDNEIDEPVSKKKACTDVSRALRATPQISKPMDAVVAQLDTRWKQLVNPLDGIGCSF